MSGSLQPHGLWPTRLLCPRDSPGKNTGVGCHFLLQRIFLTQGSNSALLVFCIAGRFLTTESLVKPIITCYCCSVAQLCLTLCNPMDCSMPSFLSFTISRSLLKLRSIELVMPSSHLILCILCRPLLLLPSIFPSIRVFSNESVLHIRWPKYWSFSFSISYSNEYSGLISFRMEWLNLLAVQGTFKSLLQHDSSKALDSIDMNQIMLVST